MNKRVDPLYRCSSRGNVDSETQQGKTLSFREVWAKRQELIRPIANPNKESNGTARDKRNSPE